MTRFGGLPGGFGMGDFQKLMQQAKQMQENVEKMQEELKNAQFSAEAGGGMVTVTVNGYGQLIGVKIKPDVLQMGDVELIEDLIVTASKEAAQLAQNEQEARAQEITGALGPIPPGLLG
ncbi:MAG TPA: YbaB/EbfC family nucleoid-associated protein [Chthonomonas sp.]|jgi:DNA-binding YbaB/EbfC family protein|uniref:YbaB/EbfC family nucleoid-associated protein n=1 Tax=Chthonomonas sp. TaxID=2282153 RepID=UPI002B4B8B27|nr:YbaB/EbfC family nucleoid-associated protein [Chthonomonas sp.]HLH79805.1 YbaB/EbfC family nucleoid-associated protein [Chthonomonas sp.]